MNPRDPLDVEAFDRYHRGELPRRFATLGAGIIVGAALVGGMVAVGSAAPQTAAAGSVEAGSLSAGALGEEPVEAGPEEGAAVLPVIEATAPATSEATSSPVASALPLAATGPAGYRIAITASGYQTELDQCQWVRMDLVPGVPIVGAHTRCGGRIVLDMNRGDEVELSGQGLDGTYRVGESRDAHAGDPAVAATAGMVGSIVLQTCYPGTSGRERLVSLIAGG